MLYSLKLVQFTGKKSYIIQCDMLVEMMLVRSPLNEHYASLFRRRYALGLYFVCVAFRTLSKLHLRS